LQLISKTTFEFSGINPNGAGGITINSLSGTSNYGNGFGTPPFANKQYLRSWGIGLPIKITRFDYNSNPLEESVYAWDVNTQSNLIDDNYKNIAKFLKRDACPTSGSVNGMRILIIPFQAT
jgi:hypothetical protein